ncbi:chitin synthase-like [Melanotaenia boesemani]|uniref:chitin synthase-like n=1 Tax=Melanotaenia boesemani TaxID=1250792 RepID=UPI001C058C03|nr:chitin synthase-like [Melanotaenia boesemani]
MQLQEESLNEEEKVFWEELREKYLYPLPVDKEKQKEMHSALTGLRNKINFSFFFVNALWLVATFTLEIFQIFSIKINMVDINLNNTGDFIQIEPLSFMFILGFTVSVLLQFVGMFYHRVYTLIHYIAYLETEPIQQKRRQKAKEKAL